MSDVIEATAEEVGVEVVPVQPQAPTSLFKTDNPTEALTKAKETADALASVIRGTSMVVSVKGKDYLTVEAWQTLGSQVGVTPVIVATRKLSDPNGWEARCEARTFDGRVLGAADSMCLREEERWADADEFEVRSMAQTRAMSRALSSVLRFIPTLAGMGGTPAEEMGRAAKGGKRKPSEKQLGYFRSLVSKGLSGENKVRVEAMASSMTAEQVSKGIEAFKDEDGDTIAELAAAAERWAGAQTDVPHEPVEQPPTDDSDVPF